MRWWTRRDELLDAVRRIGRNPTLVARTVLYQSRDDGYSLGWALRRSLSPEARRRLAVDLLRADPVVLEFEAGGFTWTVPTGDEVTGELLAVGEYSAREVASLRAWFTVNRPRGGEVVVEVGANLGTTTLPLVRAGWRVLALEPVPRTFDFLARNVERNGMHAQATCQRVAASDREGTAVMAVTFALAASRVVDRGVDDGTDRPIRPDEVEVPVRPLDALVADVPFDVADVGFVWCDAEGHEPNVIRGGTTLWSAGVPLYAECGPSGGRDGFAAEAARHFRSFVPASELVDQRAAATERPIENLPSFLGGLTALTSVLMLPRGSPAS